MLTYLSVELVQNIFQIVAFNRLLGVKQLQELLHKLWSNKNLQCANFNQFVDD
jgi:hypothetical protein